MWGPSWDVGQTKYVHCAVHIRYEMHITWVVCTHQKNHNYWYGWLATTNEINHGYVQYKSYLLFWHEHTITGDCNGLETAAGSLKLPAAECYTTVNIQWHLINIVIDIINIVILIVGQCVIHTVIKISCWLVKSRSQMWKSLYVFCSCNELLFS